MTLVLGGMSFPEINAKLSLSFLLARLKAILSLIESSVLLLGSASFSPLSQSVSHSVLASFPLFLPTYIPYRANQEANMHARTEEES